MDPRYHADRAGKRADIGDSTAVDADLVGQNPLPNQLLGQRSIRASDLFFASLKSRSQALHDRVLERFGGMLAGLLVSNRHDVAEFSGRRLRNSFVYVV